MLSHVDMAPAGGFKLFGKVITQCAEQATQAAPVFVVAQDAAAEPAARTDRTTAIKREAAYMDDDKQQQQQRAQLPEQGAEARRTQLQESAEARAAAAPLPCPRCRSRETKFCYFNNYNVNQPRHFCKACHRYWTAGGALRNVPVGAGRRKNRPLGPIVAGFHHQQHHRAAGGFVLGFPSPASSPTSPSPLYSDRWQLGPDRRF